MSRGEPLTDTDRQPWLEIIRKTAVSSVDQGPGPTRDEDQKPGIIIARSALKGSYRSALGGEALSEAEGSKHFGKLPTRFVYMKVLMDRMMKCQGHFMKAAMLYSQLKTLESPENEERVVTVSIEWSTEDQVREVVRALSDGREHMTAKH
ncbi:hypothetical protein DEU56DRAFT_394690 [Suillus clintonianus]|uniref:uncharacterized protein n=1 Tax=Suillus clintonianus TaxID=1904413 RepID=UPI001B873057|nr:uncharacterized protein DEU56DRAFT_394690 [Suillus clintonianus]KAG2135508.1 hypothetical protein DEU56DRAFT_394690 [Suillus clintonianus]